LTPQNWRRAFAAWNGAARVALAQRSRCSDATSRTRIVAARNLHPFRIAVREDLDSRTRGL